jgi:lysozyme
MDMALMIAELRRDEGERLTSYIDTEGYWTIGVGHLIDPKRGADPTPFGVDLRNGGTITREQSDTLLSRDIVLKMSGLDANIPWWRDLSEVRQRVILNMAFNLGVMGLMMFKIMLAAIKAGDYKKAGAQMLASKWASQVKGRADRLAAMMVNG